VTSGDLSVRVALRQGGLTSTAPPPTLLTTTPTPPTTGVVSSQTGDMVSGISAVRLGNEAAAGLRVPPGYLIMTVSAGSHADSLGIAPGDVLIEINGSPVRLGGFVAPARPRGGQAGAAAATVMRSGERRTLRLGTPPRRRPI
jgi:S1-C subfamily serine protease